VRPGGNVAAGAIALIQPSAGLDVSIETLGGFSVLRDGRPVERSQWQSRRARELLKLLVARRGRPASRSMLMEALWPEEDPQRVANRLSVALSTIRAVLDPDRQPAPAEYVIADNDSVALNLDLLDIDLERFLASAHEGIEQLRNGDTELGLSLLEAAEAIYAGDFLEDNPYDDWAASAREEARAAYVASARALARHAGDPDSAVRYLLRILEVDRYDEDANLDLVRALSAARRHGEAQRHYLAYRRAMAELGVEPMPFPDRGGPMPRGPFSRP
jgi:DNA-binding SARP family transcriptional activator